MWQYFNYIELWVNGYLYKELCLMDLIHKLKIGFEPW